MIGPVNVLCHNVAVREIHRRLLNGDHLETDNENCHRQSENSTLVICQDTLSAGLHQASLTADKNIEKTHHTEYNNILTHSLNNAHTSL